MNENLITLHLRAFPASLRTALNIHCAAQTITQSQVMSEALRLYLAVHDGGQLIEIDEPTRERLAYVLHNAVAPAEVA
ncbi:MAG: hypothetical protein MH825_13060 [Cyanobacteria bacterium]|nr:hypothetical protein [Cyanobacteriota bacterium]